MFSWLWPRSKDKPRGEPPKFVVPLQPLQVKHGSKVVLEATVRGQPTPRVIWYHLDKEVSPSQEFIQEHDETTGRVSLTIREIFIDDKGLYRCVAVNQYGRDETASYITVEDIEMLEKCELRQAPRITLPLQAQVVKKGSSLDLLARYEAFPPPTIKWYRQGKELKPSRDFVIEHTDDETSLHVEEVFEDDSGEYEVRVFNEAGEARSVATVMVIEPQEVIDMEPPKFIKPLQPQIVPEGEVAILEAEVTAKPEAVFQWYRHGQEITHDEELEVQITSENNKSTLVLGELFEDDSGDYTVAAENPVGRAASTATLLVEGEGAEEAEPPVFNPPLTPIRVMDGEEVRFSCKVTGKPMPKLSWFQNGRPIGHHREVRLTQTPEGRAGLQILEVFPEDAGDYTCIARNKAGEARTTANLTVEAYEYLPDSEQATVTSVSEKNVFSGSPSEEDETMEIEKDSESDSEAGSSPYFCNRLEEKIEVKEGTTVRLITKANGYPRPTIKWYVDGSPVEVTEALTLENYEDGTAILTLHKTTLNDYGVYTCEAMNRNGVDTTVTTVVVLEEHTEATSKAYRKPEWVTRMEELKDQMAGIVERSRARRRCIQAQQSSSSKPAVILQCSASKLLSTPLMSQSATTIDKSHQPLMHSTPIMIQSSPSVLQTTPNVSQYDCIASFSPIDLPTSNQGDPKSASTPTTSNTLVDLNSVSCDDHAFSSSVPSMSATSMSIDSLERPSVSQDPSCMSSRDTISEIDTEYGSHTDIECRSDSQCTESQGDRLAQLEVASSLSIGDLSMGSDSVFVSETETVSDGTSRRPSGYTLNPIYLTEDQALSISKTSLLSPSTKHVHFKFEANTPSTTSEDERLTESPNFAQAVLSNYLSSHRNSISQVIEALSSLAQADITAEIEMTIEQNKKDKRSAAALEAKTSSLDASSFEVDPESIPSIEITEPKPISVKTMRVNEDSASSSDLASFKALSNVSGSEKKEKHSQNVNLAQEAHSVNPESSFHRNISRTEKDKIDKVVPQITQSSKENIESVVPICQKELITNTKGSSKGQATEKAEKSKGTKIVPTDILNTKRKSILKNPGSHGKTATANPQPSIETMKVEQKVTRQLTPTPRRKPILKKESMVSSKTPNKKDSMFDRPNPSQMSEKESKEEKEEPQKICKTSDTNEARTKNSNAEREHGYGPNLGGQNGITHEDKMPFKNESSVSKEDSSRISDLCQIISPLAEKSSSAPSTPMVMKKERPSPPSKLPLVMTRELSADSLRESRIPRVRSNESTPATTPNQVRKFSQRNDDSSSKIPMLFSREHSSDSLSGWPSPKRNVYSEPSSPMSTPQLIRKTFKQIHENSKIPMPVYQYSSTEELEDSSPDSPRASRANRQRSLVRPQRTMSVDRAMDFTLKKTSDENFRAPRTSSRTQSPLPVSPRIQSPIPGRVQSPTLVKMSGGRVQSPVMNRMSSPIHGKSQTPSQSSSRVTSPGSTPRTVISPGSTPRTVISPGSTPYGLQSPASTPKTLQSPVSTPKRVKSPVPQSSLYSPSDALSKTGARPKITRASLATVKESFATTASPKRSPGPSKYISASDSEQHPSSVSSSKKKSSRNSKNGGLRRADSLEEFILLENECMD